MTGRRTIASKLKGATKRAAFGVMMTSTMASCFTSSLARLTALKAAMLADTPRRIRRSRSSLIHLPLPTRRQTVIHLIDQPQTLQGQQGISDVDHGGLVRDDVRETAGRNDPGRAHFLTESRYQPFNETDIPEDHAGLDAPTGVSADG